MPSTPPAAPRAGDDLAASSATIQEDAVAQRLAAEKVEEEATAVAKDRDTTAQRASEALACAAKERAAAAATVAPEPSGAAPGGPSAPPPDLRAAMLHHEAVALLQLHSQAVAVSNIRNHVTTILDVDSGNFNHWRDQFLLILGKFSLQDHIREEPPAPIPPDWARMDCVVKSWIVATLTDDPGEIISAQGSTARHAWLVVESQFLGNREARSIHLETRFHNLVQGNLSVTDYCRKLKKMADDLTALGEVVTDHTLILNVIHGLNERFSHVGTLLRRARPFPTFLEARDDLILEELTMETRKDAPATTLAASTTPSPAPVSSGTGAGGHSKPPNNRRSKRDGGGKGNSGGGPPG
ncbi:uncharacterized protein [Miscanthus floridulus]|uniref:uncharacterized protein n=1 Tax=Miscanthus floridulus TaxID=154761 RepID=UPI00345B02B8